MGHHVRRTIVEQAKGLVGKEVARAATDNWQLPDTQEEINEQAEAALRDLFPRIPNFDKQIIIEHSFRKVGLKFLALADFGSKLTGHFIQGQGYGKPKVGTSELPLYRRVQLAVLAHIRHTHTRYDQLLKEVDWYTARKTVEETCLDILVKWRGDEETGRDQLDDILREVVVISDDSDSDDSDDSDDDGDEISNDDDYFPEFQGAGPVSTVAEPTGAGTILQVQQPTLKRQRKAKAKSNRISKQLWKGAAKPKKQAGTKKNKRGFKRYEAVQKRWEEAVHRNRHAHNAEAASHASLDKMPSPSAQQRPSVEIMSPMPRLDPMRDNREHRISQQVHGEGREYGHRIRPDEVSAANYHREEHSYASRVDSDIGRSEAVVIGRRVARFPTDSRAAPAPEKFYHHGDLKDFLLPSIEPISPHSRLDAPQSIRRGIRVEPVHPEQVPAGQTNPPSRQHVPLESRLPEVENHNPPMNHGLRPAMGATTEERIVPRYRLHYESGSRPHSTVEPHEVSRAYRVREPIEDVRHPYAAPMAGNRRVIRIHREPRPGEMWEAEPTRRRQLSPRRLVPYGRASPSLPFGATEHRRIEYRGASASGFQPQPQILPPGPSRPLFYEVRSPAQAGSWHGSTFVRPAPFPAAQPQVLEGSHDVLVRRPIQEPPPFHRVPAEYQHRGRVEVLS